jgi:hypothetical protein
MPVIENMPPPQPRPAVVAPAPTGAGMPNDLAAHLEPRAAAGMSMGGQFEVAVPDRIPPHCVHSSARTYAVNPLLLLSVLKVESNGRTGIVAKNTNATYDLGPAQFNTSSWAKLLIEKYKIPREALINDMCQAVQALGFAVRTEINNAGGDLWKGIGNYHSRTPKHHVKYVKLVYGAYKQMTTKGKF